MDDTGLTRIVERACERESWRIATRAPRGAEALMPAVHAYAERAPAPLQRREPPSGLATIVINLGADLGVTFPGEGRRVFRAGGAFFTGPGPRHAVTDTNGAQDGAQVMLTALGARRLVGIPLELVGDRLIDPIDLIGTDFRLLIERVQEATSEEARVAIVEAAIRARLDDAGSPPPDLSWALGRLQASGGRVRIAALAAQIGCSRKHLSERFRREFGMAPKLFARTLRFDAAVRAVKAGRIESWAALAVSCGYSDQAHLSRDFLAFAGSPPAAFAARRLDEGRGFDD